MFGMDMVRLMEPEAIDRVLDAESETGTGCRVVPFVPAVVPVIVVVVVVVEVVAVVINSTSLLCASGIVQTGRVESVI